MKNDLILFLGQSNMVGQAERLAESEPVPGALEYRFLTDELVPLRDPAGEDLGRGMRPVAPYAEGVPFWEWTDSVLLEGAWARRTTLLPSFARAYIRASGRGVVAVHAAKGCTRAEHWLPGTEGYGAVVTKARAAVRKAGGGGVYAVWLQGESDMLARTAPEDYIDRVLKIKNGLKADLGLCRFGVIRVGRFSSLAPFDGTPPEDRLRADLSIIAAQDSLCERDPDCLMLTSAADGLITGDPRYVNPEAAGHFSALGLQVLGREAGARLGAAVREIG